MGVRYVHDCPVCVSLGEYGVFDLYAHCAQPITVIARRSDVDSDYVSGMELAEFYPELMEAKKRALERGLIGAGVSKEFILNLVTDVRRLQRSSEQAEERIRALEAEVAALETRLPYFLKYLSRPSPMPTGYPNARPPYDRS